MPRSLIKKLTKTFEKFKIGNKNTIFHKINFFFYNFGNNQPKNFKFLQGICIGKIQIITEI